jgi:hypothetical protein
MLHTLWAKILALAGGAVTLGGIGQAVKWFYEVRKLRAENAALKHSEDIKRAAMTLERRANILLSQTNHPSLLRAEWASFLENPALIDEALREAGAVRNFGKEDRWIIGAPPRSGRFRSPQAG